MSYRGEQLASPRSRSATSGSDCTKDYIAKYGTGSSRVESPCRSPRGTRSRTARIGLGRAGNVTHDNRVLDYAGRIVRSPSLAVPLCCYYDGPLDLLLIRPS